MRAPSVRTELFVNFNLAELDQLADPQWEELSGGSVTVDDEEQTLDDEEQTLDDEELTSQHAIAESMPQILPIAPATPGQNPSAAQDATPAEVAAQQPTAAARRVSNSPPDDGSDTDDTLALEDERRERAERAKQQRC